MDETLVVIDMQPHFISRDQPLRNQNYPSVIDNVIRQCKLAMRRNDYIIFVEYDRGAKRSWGSNPSLTVPSLQELIDYTATYGKRFFVHKKSVSGGQQLNQCFEDNNLPREIVRVCGVYTNACVQGTVEDFLELSPQTQIKIVRNAVSSHAPEPTYNREAIGRLTSASPRITAIGPHLW